MKAPKNLYENPHRLPKDGRLLALDYGSVRIGLALSDPGQSIASPLGVWTKTPKKELPEKLAELIEDEGVVGILFGIPVSLSGDLGPMAQGHLKVARRLARELPVPMGILDERHTSNAANEAFKEAGVRASRRRGKVDKVAASLMLQAFLDQRR